MYYIHRKSIIVLIALNARAIASPRLTLTGKYQKKTVIDENV